LSLISSLLKSLKISCLIIGTTIGAGFASGREIWEFFASHGNNSSYFVLFSMCLFSLCCYIILRISKEQHASHYVPVLDALIGRKLRHLYDGLILLYLLSTTVVMFAGSGATLTFWSIPYWLGVGIMGCLVWLVFMKDANGILSINSVIIPVLIGTLVTVCLLFLWLDLGQEGSMVEQSRYMLPSALAFTSLNILPLLAVLSPVATKLNKQEMLQTSIISAVGLCSIALVYNESLLKIAHQIDVYEVPLFAILHQLPHELYLGVTIILWLAIYTTALSGVFGLVSRFKERLQARPWMIATIIIVIVFPLTAFGFSNLIKVLYPLYGVINLFLLCMILLYPLAKGTKMR